MGTAPRARCWGRREEGSNWARGHPGHLLTLQEAKLCQHLHLTPYVQLTMAERGAGSWPERLEGLRSSGNPGMGAGKGQALPSGQLPFLFLSCLSLEPRHLLWVTSQSLQVSWISVWPGENPQDPPRRGTAVQTPAQTPAAPVTPAPGSPHPCVPAMQLLGRLHEARLVCLLKNLLGIAHQT